MGTVPVALGTTAESPWSCAVEAALQSDADWQRVLCALRAACPPDDPSTRTAGSGPWHVLLVPLQLGPQLVGALLLALPGGDEGRRGGAPPSPLHRALLETPGALHEVAACVAECCLSPVLPAVQQVCSAAVRVASCSSVPQLSAALCSALAAPLASELFVELGARLALLPHSDAARGVLFGDSSAQGYGGAWGKQRSFRTSSSTPFDRPLAATGVGSAAALSAEPRLQSLGSLPLAAKSSLGLGRSGGVRGDGGLGGSMGRAPMAAYGSVEGVGASAQKPQASGHDEKAPELGLRKTASRRSLEGSADHQKAAYLPLVSTLAAALIAEACGGAEAADSAQSTAASRGTGVPSAVSTAPLLRIAGAAVPSAAALLQDPAQPSADVLRLLSRPGGGGGGGRAAGATACMVALACVWTPPKDDKPQGTRAARCKPARNPAQQQQASYGQDPGRPAPPALVFYLTSPTPLPRALLTAVRDRAGELLQCMRSPQVLAPAALRALSGAAASEWACLRVLATKGPAAAAAAGMLGCAGVPSLLAVSQLFSSVVQGASTGPIQPLMGPRESHRHVESPFSTASAPPQRGSRFGTTGGAGLDLPSVTGPAIGNLGTSSLGFGFSTGFSPASPRNGAAGACSLGAVTSSAALGASGGVAMATNGSSVGWGPPLPRGAVALSVARGFNIDDALQSLLPPFARASGASPGPDGSSAWPHALLGAATQLGIATTPLSTNVGMSMQGPASLQPMSGASALALALAAIDLPNGGDDGESHNQAGTMSLMLSTFLTELDGARQAAGPACGVHAGEDVTALRLQRALGTGCQSVVMLATLHAMRVAVKVMLPPESDVSGDEAGEEDGQQQAKEGGGGGPGGGHQRRRRALLRGVRELAVMSSISHPNIVQVYSYCTRVRMPAPPDAKGSAPAGLVVVPESELAPEPLCTVLIMEYCDMGSLADAIDSGLFVRAAAQAARALARDLLARAPAPANPAASANPVSSISVKALAGPAAASSAGAMLSVAAGGNGGSRLGRAVELTGVPQASGPGGELQAGGPAMHAVYLTLLEVALALRHLHSLSLVHCDLKPANVLLRSSTSDPRGFTAKLSDFGFVSLLELEPDEGEGDGSAAFAAQDSPRSGAAEAADGSPRRKLRFPDRLGTVTHMAPECFIQGAPLDASIDIYAFGILMWELYTGRAPYAEHANTNFLQVPLEPQQRPTAAALVRRIQALLDACGGGGGGAGAAVAPLSGSCGAASRGSPHR
ncbi:hypothetical protein HYH03_005615 [Edaphochlamys debaryana]|uniref:Protein kinase domain-containing protein n=1 Tax=Edaphochlamys debaryana TaxID=47281 RepID=A0A835Y7B8_9CHLO|nr:hypothetical protein HYH03_005615 [Edaphochlamys debaryana]|eukprot:KAG2496387.1 hypothetical protein HYH03_005615 [Edaphochlamys debaryana]